MSAAVAQRNSPHMPRSSSRNQSPMDKKANVKAEEPSNDSSLPSNKADTKSPPRPEAASVKQEKDTKSAVSNAETAQPLAPPPKPSQSNGNENDYFSGQHGNSHYSLEPNLFEQSFGNPPDTPGKSLLPPVASLTSPQLLSAGGQSLGSLNWGSSLRSGPLSPAMLSGPTGTGEYFDSSLRGGFPTPNESSLRTGLTPGGGGSMFPAPSPSSQALFNSMTGGGATPGTLEFQRSALNAAAAKSQAGNTAAAAQTSQPSTIRAETTMAPSNQTAATSQPFAHHDNEAANGLYLLAQAGNESQSNNQFAVPSQPAHVNQDKRPRNGNGSIASTAPSAQGQSEASGDHSNDDSKANSRKPKRTSTGKANNKRKTDETPAKASNKKAKSNASSKNDNVSLDGDSDEDMGMEEEEGENGKKMTDEEKRKNFLERNRVAALKCRQRKKQWLANLQSKVEIFSTENDALNAQVSSLREEILNLKTILIAHKDCPISQTQPQSVSSYLPPGQQDFQQHPHSYMAMQQGQPLMTGPPRRFS